MAQEVLGKTIGLPKIELPKLELPKLDLEYPAFAGKPASSKDNWVFVDFANAKLAKVFRVEDEKVKE